MSTRVSGTQVRVSVAAPKLVLLWIRVAPGQAPWVLGRYGRRLLWGRRWGLSGDFGG